MARSVNTLIGDGTFDEPGGLSFAGDTPLRGGHRPQPDVVVDIKNRTATPLVLSDPNKLL